MLLAGLAKFATKLTPVSRQHQVARRDSRTEWFPGLKLLNFLDPPEIVINFCDLAAIFAETGEPVCGSTPEHWPIE